MFNVRITLNCKWYDSCFYFIITSVIIYVTLFIEIPPQTPVEEEPLSDNEDLDEDSQSDDGDDSDEEENEDPQGEVESNGQNEGMDEDGDRNDEEEESDEEDEHESRTSDFFILTIDTTASFIVYDWIIASEMSYDIGYKQNNGL